MVAPLAGVLATRLAARRRRARAGAIDLRKTLRKSMSTGGVPIDLVQRNPRPARPELVVLCDMSGSVAGFSHFTLLLVHALPAILPGSGFAFIDTTDEVTHLFGPDADLAVAIQRITLGPRSSPATGIPTTAMRSSLSPRISLVSYRRAVRYWSSAMVGPITAIPPPMSCPTW